MHWLRALFNKQPTQIPAAQWEQCLASIPFLSSLSDTEKDKLKSTSEAFLDQMRFTGAAGFAITDDVAITIAAQACLPVMNLSLKLYRDIPSIIVYPAAILIAQQDFDEAGVVHEWNEPSAGASVDAGGPVLLSWEDVQDVHDTDANVVIHEFVHKIDMEGGAVNGCPVFLPGMHDGISRTTWAQVFSHAYEDFVGRVEAAEVLLPDDFDLNTPEHEALWAELTATMPLDPYAAQDPAEFFAVAAEGFFIHPQALQDCYPNAYQLLTAYFRQDPLARFSRMAR